MRPEDVLLNYPKQQDYLIEILLAYQALKPTHHLDEEDIVKIASYLDIPQSRVSGVISFYTLLSEKPKGKHVIQICKNIPCYLNQADEVIKTALSLCKLNAPGTSEDQQFTVELVSCLGACDKAPALRINHQLYQDLSKNKIKALIASLKEK